MKNNKIAVVLVNLGGPSNQAEVKPFLKSLFSDADIFHFPFGRIGQKFFSSMIAFLRAKKSRAYYRQIGGGSPLQKNTELLATKLEEKLFEIATKDFTYKVFIAQRYWHPYIAETINKIIQYQANEIVLIPLYPQYSTTTTLSITNEWQRKWKSLTNTIARKKNKIFDEKNLDVIESVKLSIIKQFYQSNLYIEASVNSIKKELAKFKEKPFLLFSAHSIPVSRIEAGDPYQTQIEETKKLILEKLIDSYDSRLCYQSKVGPVAWLAPDIVDEIKKLGQAGIKNLLLFPIAFVTENLETLYELDIKNKNIALENGIRNYQRAATVDTEDKFIEALVDLISKVE